MKNALFAAVIVTLTATQAHAVPKILNYQGFLIESGTPVTGTRDMTFHIFAAPTGGSALFTEVHDGANTVTVSAGNFSVLVGEITGGGIPAAVFDGNDRYMEVVVGAVTLPRQRIVSVAYAIRSETATAVRQLLRFTRTGLTSTSSDASKEALCASELGAGYTAAVIHEVAAFGGQGGSTAFGTFFTFEATTVRWAYGTSAGDEEGFEFLGFVLTPTIAGTGPIACVNRAAPIRATRTFLAPTDSDAAKDAQCATEFGNDYIAATVLDYISEMRGHSFPSDQADAAEIEHAAIFVCAANTQSLILHTHSATSGGVVRAITNFAPPAQSPVICIRR